MSSVTHLEAQQQQPAGFGELPLDVLVPIFTFTLRRGSGDSAAGVSVGSIRDLASAASVCTGWRAASLQPSIYSSLIFNEDVADARAAFAAHKRDPAASPYASRLSVGMLQELVRRAAGGLQQLSFVGLRWTRVSTADIAGVLGAAGYAGKLASLRIGGVIASLSQPPEDPWLAPCVRLAAELARLRSFLVSGASLDVDEDSEQREQLRRAAGYEFEDDYDSEEEYEYEEDDDENEGGDRKSVV